jgi:hypothetical protein
VAQHAAPAKALRGAVRHHAESRVARNVAREVALGKEMTGAKPGRPCGIRRRVGDGRGRVRRGKRVRLVGATAVRVRVGRKSGRLVARSAKVRTVVGRLDAANRKSLVSQRTENSKRRPPAGAEIRPPNIRTTLPRPNNRMRQLRVKSMTMMSSRAGAVVVGVKSVAK